LFALNIVAWPRDPALLDLLGETLRGGADTARSAGIAIVGGHSIDDPEPKYGLVALGEVRPDKVIANTGARPGDHLVLTKPIGTGILSTALKRDLISDRDLAPAVATMSALNAGGMRAMRAVGDAVHASTDVTGFGLLGHLHNLLEASGVGARVDAARVPLLPGARDLAQRGVVPGGSQRNLEAADGFTTWRADVALAERLLLTDAQTSGGLLIAVPPTHRDRLLEALEREGTEVRADLGHVTSAPAGTIEVVYGDA